MVTVGNTLPGGRACRSGTEESQSRGRVPACGTSAPLQQVTLDAVETSTPQASSNAERAKRAEMLRRDPRQSLRSGWRGTPLVAQIGASASSRTRKDAV